VVPGYFFVNVWPVQLAAMSPGRKRGSPIGGLIAGIMALGISAVARCVWFLAKAKRGG